MNDLTTWSSGGLARPSRQYKQQTKVIVEQTKLAGLKVDAEAALTGRIMERAVDIDHYRHALANGDETLNHVLTRIELGFVAKAERIQRNLGSEFPL